MGNLDVLASAVQAPTRFANELIAKKLVPYGSLDAVLALGIGDNEKSTKILKAVLERLKTNPEDFDKFTGVLERSGAITPQYAEKLKADYENHEPRKLERSGAITPQYAEKLEADYENHEPRKLT